MTQNSYQQKTLAGATGIELIVAAYDGALRFLYRSIQAVEEDDVRGRRIAVKRVIDIFMYLQARLRMDIGGEPARALSDFYAAMFNMTLEASHAASRPQFTEVIACLRNVREAWSVVAQDPEAQKLVPRDLRSRDERYANVPPRLTSPAASQDEPAPVRWSA